MTTLTKPQIKQLRGMAHQLSPLLLIGKNNITDTVLSQTEQLLDDHELIKGQLQEGSMLTAKEAAAELRCRSTDYWSPFCAVPHFSSQGLQEFYSLSTRLKLRAKSLKLQTNESIFAIEYRLALYFTVFLQLFYNIFTVDMTAALLQYTVTNNAVLNLYSLQCAQSKSSQHVQRNHPHED